MIDQAQQDFQLVGTSPLECDTIPGRQCVASFLFLKKQFENVLIYLKTVKEYLGKDDDFNWNYGIACA
jgi:intraflagellar transport protein 56